MALTEQQVFVLGILEECGPLDAHEIGKDLNFNRIWPNGTYDKAHACLSRLQDRGYVLRERQPGNAPSLWYLTGSGAETLREARGGA